jgi:excisionase family DNA binding protein
MENLITVKDVAVMVNLSEQTIRRNIKLKRIPFYRIFGSVRFKPSEIQIWFDNREEEKTGKKNICQEADLLNEAEVNK